MKRNFLMTIGMGIVGFLAGFLVKKGDKSGRTELSNDKYMLYFSVLDKWMRLRENGDTVERYFLNHGYHRIGIYGVAQLGNHLIAELSKSEVEVVYGIDRRAELLYAGIPVYGLEDDWEQVDAIVVTPIYDYSNIKKQLEKKGNYRVISLESIILESIGENMH